MTSFYVARLLRWVTFTLLGTVILSGACAATPAAPATPEAPAAAVAPSPPDPSAPPVQQGGGQPAKQPVAQSPVASAEAEFTVRIDQYIALHNKLAQDLPRLPKEAKREEIFARQQELLKRLQAARAGAKPGDIFTPAMQEYARRMMAKLFAGPAGGQLRASIMDENPVSVKLSVNMPYPSTVPLATMPPTVLASLPKTPEVLEYRFIGDDLILLDVGAQMIVDFVTQALPK